MSQLRQQLQSAADAHRAMRYPGDLAGDVLGAHSRRNTFRLLAWSVTSIAAAILLALIPYKLYPLLMKSSSVTPEDEQLSFVIPGVDLELPDKPDMPANIDLMPAYQALSLPAPPSFPSLDSLKEDSTTDLSN